MVLSTLHSNDAISSIPRLSDMGIDPFLLSTSLIGAMSQRLIRNLCPTCRVEAPTTDQEAELFEAHGLAVPPTTFQPGGCGSCQGIGYRGRRAIHEIMPVTPEVSKLLGARAPMETVREVAIQEGYVIMQVRALELVRDGITSMAEAQRVVFLDVSHGRKASAIRTSRPHLRAA